ncbi:putative 28S ribosomal protein S6, mitochondrial [Chionoecetes opilio]|uniref:Small ribosomal subunit protein bS6m n=1 Tax=Chionoecetes opilio TaxID=41210 RepID=A0A8J4Y3Y9_CHIOP|nr:putative 28S ribosomal protein S6, mitochondrial [Chionoecetes opilio]
MSTREAEIPAGSHPSPPSSVVTRTFLGEFCTLPYVSNVCDKVSSSHARLSGVLPFYASLVAAGLAGATAVGRRITKWGGLTEAVGRLEKAGIWTLDTVRGRNRSPKDLAKQANLQSMEKLQGVYNRTLTTLTERLRSCHGLVEKGLQASQGDGSVMSAKKRKRSIDHGSQATDSSSDTGDEAKSSSDDEKTTAIHTTEETAAIHTTEIFRGATQTETSVRYSAHNTRTHTHTHIDTGVSMATLFELSLIVKHVPKPRTVSIVKRVAETILDEGGFVSKVESLGARDLPYRMKAHGQIHSKGSYFLLHFVAPPTRVKDIADHCKRDVDLVRPSIMKQEEPLSSPCTLHEEIKPPVYRIYPSMWYQSGP